MPLSFFLNLSRELQSAQATEMNPAVEHRKIIRLKVTESTNSAALEAGQQGAAPGTVIVAEAQTGGRGRMNRSWLSLPGMGLYFSIILRPDLAPEHLPKVTIAAGLAVCKAVETQYNIRPGIKWPNDLLLEGRKFGGILSETAAMHNSSAGQRPLVVIGAGVNLFPPAGGFPAELKERATALSLHVHKKITAELLLQACVAALEEELQRLEQGDFQAILKEWLQRDAIRDKELSWVTPGGQKVTGVSLGPDAEGILRIRDRAGEVHEVLSGDVNLVGNVLG
jgi:BirA family biotin operon repressor/biotin-[acetyl-CoA-carboxylase] ligase